MKKIILLVFALFVFLPVFAEGMPKNNAQDIHDAQLKSEKNIDADKKKDENKEQNKNQEQDKDNNREKVQIKEEIPTKDNVKGAVVTNEKNLSWQEYTKKAQEKVSKNFNPPNDPENKIRSVSILCKVSKDGSLLAGGNAFITKSSGLKEFDDAAIRAVKTSNPFDKFPESSKQTSAIMRFILTNY